ncbi:hypothetical protein WMF38_40060 [Sorangium sp. So ce118]
MTGRTGGILKVASRLRRESARADWRDRKTGAEGAAEPALASDAVAPGDADNNDDDDDPFDGA